MGKYAFLVYWVDCRGEEHYSDLMYDERKADKFAEEWMYAGAIYYDAPRVIILEI